MYVIQQECALAMAFIFGSQGAGDFPGGGGGDDWNKGQKRPWWAAWVPNPEDDEDEEEEAYLSIDIDLYIT